MHNEMGSSLKKPATRGLHTEDSRCTQVQSTIPPWCLFNDSEVYEGNGSWHRISAVFRHLI